MKINVIYPQSGNMPELKRRVADIKAECIEAYAEKYGSIPDIEERPRPV